nr:MAG TPA: hypothetical protein [Caudoviricetes sp.]
MRIWDCTAEIRYSVVQTLTGVDRGSHTPN